MSQRWSYGEIFEAIEPVIPDDRPALVHGKRTILWGEFKKRTNNIAQNLLANGIKPGDKVAFYTRNGPEYPEGIAAAFKAGLVHVNVNYRYIEKELIYLIDNSDSSVVVYHQEFRESVNNIKRELPEVKIWLETADGSECIYEKFATEGDGSSPEIKHSPDDLLFLYTGGTTGMPKGVMWKHDDLFQVLGAGGNIRMGTPACETLDELVQRIKTTPRPVNLPLPPIMHGTGLLSAIGAMSGGGTCVTLPQKSFDPEAALEAIDQNRVTAVTIVGDAFARPLLEVLNSNPEKYDISSVSSIHSSGVMWTKEIKSGLLQHNEEMILSDAFSSSEAIGLGTSITTKDEEVEVAKFTLGPFCKVFTEDLIEVKPGSDQSGMVAVKGFLPVGYYKDEEKTEKTFKTINGERYSIPGDWVRVEADGSLTLLGRGSNCINTAGEKVFPEEVEEALKFHEDIADCLVVGIEDEKWGQAITAVVQLRGQKTNGEEELKAFAREHLAAYKIPKKILFKDDLNRAPNGKADYKLIKEYVEKSISV